MTKVEELTAKVEELTAEIDRLTGLLDEADKRLAAIMADAMQGALPGWVLTAKNPNYNGVTAGFQFRGGKALVADRDGMEQKVRTVCADFGVKFERVADLRHVEVAQVETAQRMIDVIGIPGVKFGG